MEQETAVEILKSLPVGTVVYYKHYKSNGVSMYVQVTIVEHIPEKWDTRKRIGDYWQSGTPARCRIAGYPENYFTQIVDYSDLKHAATEVAKAL